MECLASFYLPEDKDNLNAMGTRDIMINLSGDKYIVYPRWLCPGKKMFDPCNHLAKKYGLDKPLATLDHFPSYDEMVKLFDGKPILPIMPEWVTEYGYKFIDPL